MGEIEIYFNIACLIKQDRIFLDSAHQTISCVFNDLQNILQCNCNENFMQIVVQFMPSSSNLTHACSRELN
jgi:hypothetical protein